MSRFDVTEIDLFLFIVVRFTLGISRCNIIGLLVALVELRRAVIVQFAEDVLFGELDVELVAHGGVDPVACLLIVVRKLSFVEVWVASLAGGTGVSYLLLRRRAHVVEEGGAHVTLLEVVVVLIVALVALLVALRVGRVSNLLVHSMLDT